MAKILAISGSLREHAFTTRILRVAAEGAREAGAEITFVDLREYPMPIYNEDDHRANGYDADAARLQDLVAESEGLLVASPEYNGSIPGGLKNAIDWLSRKSDKYATNEVFKDKWGAMITSSPGSFGGLRCMAHLRGILSIMGVTVLPTEIAVTFVGQKFDGDSPIMTDEKTKHLLESLGASLAQVIGNTSRSASR
jgi:chromate reductase, NAD(P)H dehydrogenase (quinone)